MLLPHLCKFSELYSKYGLGAVKNLWLLMSLIPIARTVNLHKLKDYVGGVLENEQTEAQSHYKRLTRKRRADGRFRDAEGVPEPASTKNTKRCARSGTLRRPGTLIISSPDENKC